MSWSDSPSGGPAAAGTTSTVSNRSAAPCWPTPTPGCSPTSRCTPRSPATSRPDRLDNHEVADGLAAGALLGHDVFKGYDPAWLAGDYPALTGWLGEVTRLPPRWSGPRWPRRARPSIH